MRSVRLTQAFAFATLALICTPGCTDPGSHAACDAESSACEPQQAVPSTVGVAAGTPLPCDVRRELAAHCWSCHGDKLQFTAPVRLLSVEDFLASAPSDPSLTVAQRARLRIHDPIRPMPPPPLPALNLSGLMALDAWLGGDTLRGGPPACEQDVTVAVTDPTAAASAGEPAISTTTSSSPATPGAGPAAILDCS